MFNSARKLIQTLGFPLMCVALFSLAGGHWAVLRTVAWTQMIVVYSQESDLLTAVEQTFSGTRPCDLCTEISKGQSKESQLPVSLKLNKKADAILVAASLFSQNPFVRDFHYFQIPEVSPNSHKDPPPSPVPIA